MSGEALVSGAPRSWSDGSSSSCAPGSNLQHIYLRRLLARSLGAVANVRLFTLL